MNKRHNHVLVLVFCVKRGTYYTMVTNYKIDANLLREHQLNDARVCCFLCDLVILCLLFVLYPQIRFQKSDIFKLFLFTYVRTSKNIKFEDTPTYSSAAFRYRAFVKIQRNKFKHRLMMALNFCICIWLVNVCVGRFYFFFFAIGFGVVNCKYAMAMLKYEISN